MSWTNLSFIVGQIFTATDANTLQSNIVSVRTSELGPTPPTLPTTGTEWWDTQTSPWYKKVWDGSQWVRTVFVDSTLHEGGTQAQNDPWGSIPMVDASQDRTDIAGTPYFPKNMLLNGRMRFWQRGNSHGVTGTAQVGADHWRLQNSTATARFHLAQNSDAPLSTRLDTSMQVRVESGQTLTAGNFVAIEQPIEGTLLRRTGFGQSVTPQFTRFSVWAYASVTGRLSVYLTNGARNVTFVGGIDITVANTWQFKQVGFLQPSSGSWHFGIDCGARLGIVIACSSNFYTGTPNAWLYTSPDVRAASGQLNGISAAGTIFRFTGAQFEIGQMATPFEMLPEAIELTLLQRYYYKTFPVDERPKPNASMWDGCIFTVCDNTGKPYGQVRLPTPMRSIAAATVQTYCPWANSSRWWRNVAVAESGTSAVIDPTVFTDQVVMVTASPSLSFSGEIQTIQMSVDNEIA